MQVEINPFAEAHYVGGESQVFCVDAKLGFDDNAAYRQSDIYAMRDTSMEDEAGMIRARRRWRQYNTSVWIRQYWMHGPRSWSGYGHYGHHPS